MISQLHAAALSSLRSEVAELNSRLVAATRAREAAEAALMRAEVQAARADQRAEQQAARHEERLTELHSVIAELGRQLERHRATVIAEEDESGKRCRLFTRTDVRHDSAYFVLRKEGRRDEPSRSILEETLGDEQRSLLGLQQLTIVIALFLSLAIPASSLVTEEESSLSLSRIRVCLFPRRLLFL